MNDSARSRSPRQTQDADEGDDDAVMSELEETLDDLELPESVKQRMCDMTFEDIRVSWSFQMKYA